MAEPEQLSLEDFEKKYGKPAALDIEEFNKRYGQTVAPATPQAEADMRSPWEVARDQALNVVKGAPQAVTALPATVLAALSGNAKDLASGAIALPATIARGVGALATPNQVTAPTNAQWEQAAQGAGAFGAGTLAGGALQAVSKYIPSTSHAGALLDQVLAAAKNEPIDTTAAQNAVARAKQLAQRGSTMPKVFKDFLRNPPTTYEEGFDFASNASKFAANATQAMKAKMGAQWAQVGKFTDAMKTANRDAAVSAGMGDLYDQAMTEYRRAKRLGDATEVLAKWTTRAAIAAGLGAAGTAGYDLYQNMKR